MLSNHWVLAVFALASSVFISLSAEPKPAQACAIYTSASNSCGANGALRNGSAWLDAFTQSSSGATVGAPGTSQGSGSNGLSADELRSRQWWLAQWERLFAEPTCASYGNCVPSSAEPTEASVPQVVTQRDIAEFRPNSAVNHSEPSGWTISRVPTNIWLEVSEHTVGGTLLGAPAEVRFTPQLVTWRYSDGGSLTTAQFGNTWATLGLAEFTETPTSHVFRDAGTYTVDAAVEYRAAYSIEGGPWTDIEGTLTVDSDPLELRAFEPSTALVDQTCREVSAAPGC